MLYKVDILLLHLKRSSNRKSLNSVQVKRYIREKIVEKIYEVNYKVSTLRHINKKLPLTTVTQ